MEILNLISGGDISKEDFKDIKEICRRYSIQLEKGKTLQDLVLKEMKTAVGGVSWMELRNMLDNFKTDILSSLAS